MPTPGRDDVVPRTLVAAAAIAWRVLAVGIAIWALVILLGRFRLVAIPLVFAVFFTAVLHPPVGWLKQRSVPKALAATAGLAALIAVVVGVGIVAGVRFAAQFEQLQDALVDGWDRLVEWATSTLPVSQTQIDDAISGVRDALGGNAASLLLGGATTLVHALLIVALTIIFLFFFLKDGPDMYAWAVERVPEDRRDATRAAARAAWRQVSAFARGQLVIAAVDAVLVAIALVVIGVPLVLTLTVVTFVGSLIPLVGPVVAGALAALAALSSGGLTDALWVVAASFAIQQAEGNLLQPYVQGRILPLHPMLILIAVTVGGIVGGVVGAFAATPFLAATVAATSAAKRARPEGTESRGPSREAA